MPHLDSRVLQLRIAAVLLAILSVSNHGLAVDDESPKIPEKTPKVRFTHPLGKAISDGIQEALEAVYSPMELEFLGTAIGRVVGKESEGDQLITKWLIGDGAFPPNSRLRMPSCVYVSSGTNDDEHPATILIEIGRGNDAFYWIRSPKVGTGTSTIQIAALIEVTTDNKRFAAFKCEKVFELKDGKWLLNKSAVTRAD